DWLDNAGDENPRDGKVRVRHVRVTLQRRAAVLRAVVNPGWIEEPIKERHRAVVPILVVVVSGKVRAADTHLLRRGERVAAVAADRCVELGHRRGGSAGAIEGDGNV